MKENTEKKEDKPNAWDAGLDAQVPDSAFGVIILFVLHIGTFLYRLVFRKKQNSNNTGSE